jgi:hypothetical protein
VAISIPLTSTTNLYSDAGAAVFDFGGTPYAAGYLFVQNAGAYVSLKTANAQGSATWGPEFATNTALVPLAGGTASLARPNGPDRIYGVRARSLAAGVPAVVYGGVFQEGEAAVLPSNQVGGTITTSGTIVQPVTGINGLTGYVNTAGTVISGTGFTVTPIIAGVYQINIAPALSAAPVVVATPSNSGGGTAVDAQVGLTSTASFQVALRDAAGSLVNCGFNFLAIVPQ